MNVMHVPIITKKLVNWSWNRLDLIHFDMWGPTRNMSIGGSRYFVTFIDDFTRHTWACLIAKKSEVFACFLKMKSLVEREMGKKIKCLRSDGGKEYFSRREFDVISLVHTHLRIFCTHARLKC